MDIVVNVCYGGYHVPDEVLNELGVENVERDNPALVQFVRDHADEEGVYKFGYSALAVVHIPDDATDYDIIEYDGYEDVIAVIDGKIVYLEYE